MVLEVGRPLEEAQEGLLGHGVLTLEEQRADLEFALYRVSPRGTSWLPPFWVLYLPVVSPGVVPP